MIYVPRLQRGDDVLISINKAIEGRIYMVSYAVNVPADFTGCVVCGYKESLRFEQYKGEFCWCW